ncbi:MAG: hypothetical protein WDW38_010110 [Sanguina aurantia]
MSRVAQRRRRRPLQGDATVDTVMPWPRRACEWRRQDPHRRHRAVATISQALIRDETRCFLGVGGHTGGRPFWKLPGNGWKEPLHTPLHVDRLATPGPKTHTVSTRCIDCHTLLRPVQGSAAGVCADAPPRPSASQVSLRSVTPAAPGRVEERKAPSGRRHRGHCHALASEGVRVAPTRPPSQAPGGRNNLTSADQRRDPLLARGRGSHGRATFWKLPGNGWKEPLHTPLHVDRPATPGPKTHTVPTRCIDCHTLLRPCPRIRRRSVACRPERRRRRPFRETPPWTLSCLGLGGRASGADKRPHRRHRAVATISQALIRDETRCLLGVGGHAGGRPSGSFQGTDGRSLCTRPFMWTVPPLRVQRRIQCRPAASTATRCCAPVQGSAAGVSRAVQRRRGNEGPFRETPPCTLSCLGLGGRATSADKRPPEAPDGRNNLTSADQRRDPLLARVGGHAGGRPSRSFQGTDGRSLCTRPVMWTVPPLRVQRRIQCRPAASTATRCCAPVQGSAAGVSRAVQRRRGRTKAPSGRRHRAHTVMLWPRRACEWRRQDPRRRHRTVATTSQALIRDETRCLLGSGVMRAGDLLEASRERMEGASAHAPSCGPSRHSGSKDAYSADPLHRLPHAAAPLSKDPPPEVVACRPASERQDEGPFRETPPCTLSCFGLGGRATSTDKRPPEAPGGRNNLTSADQRRDPLLARVGGHAGGRPSRSFQGTDGRSLCTRPFMWTVPPLRVQRRIHVACRPASERQDEGPFRETPPCTHCHALASEGVRPAPTSPHRRHRTVATTSQALIRDETRCLLGSGVMRAGDLLEASRERMEGASAHAPSCGPSRHSGSKDAYSADPLHRLPHAAAPLSKDPPPDVACRPASERQDEGPFRETPPCTLSCFGLGGRATSTDKPPGGTGRSQQPHKR